MKLNREKIYRTLTTLDTIVDRTLNLQPKEPNLSGFHYNRDLLRAAMANTYLETVGTHADSIHLAIKKVPISNIYWEYLRMVEILSVKCNFLEHDAVLAFDFTDENFYGKLESLWIHGWTGERAVKGKFKFLTCALVSSDIPQKIPLFSIPIHIGYNLSKDVCFCIEVVRPLFRSIKLTLFDRGFYSKELMYTLMHSVFPYLIFVPKNKMVKRELDDMIASQKKTIHYQFKFNKDKTILHGETTIAFLKQIFDSRTKKSFDWAFATNQSEINLDHLIPTYKGRWRIETGFRIQDEATIKSKSKNIGIRFFIYVYEQALQLLWAVLYKEEVSFKGFLIQLSDTCTERVNRAEMRAKNHTNL